MVCISMVMIFCGYEVKVCVECVTRQCLLRGLCHPADLKRNAVHTFLECNLSQTVYLVKHGLW